MFKALSSNVRLEHGIIVSTVLVSLISLISHVSVDNDYFKKDYTVSPALFLFFGGVSYYAVGCLRSGKCIITASAITVIMMIIYGGIFYVLLDKVINPMKRTYTIYENGDARTVSGEEYEQWWDSQYSK